MSKATSTFVLKKKDDLTMPQMEHANKTIFKQNIENVIACNTSAFSFSNNIITIRTYKKFFKISFHAYSKYRDSIDTGDGDSGKREITEDEFKESSRMLFEIFSFADLPHRVVQPYSVDDYDEAKKTYGIYAIDKESFEANDAMNMFKEHLKNPEMLSNYRDIDVFSLNNFFIISLDELITKLKYIPYYCSVELFTSLWKQLSYMEHLSCGILSFDISRIILFRGRFIYLYNHDELLKIVDGRKINVTIENISSYSSNSIHAPEINSIMTKGELPSLCHKSASYYALGMIVLHTLFAFDGNRIAHATEERLDQILDTKLYFAILRACDVNPRTRKLLYI
jgi:hypothetical protein